MLNSPARNANAKASADAMYGVDRLIEAAIRSGLPYMPRSSAQYASNGLPPVSAIRMPPTTTARMMA